MKYGPLVIFCCMACTQIADCSLDPNISEFYIEFDHTELRLVTFESVTNDLSSEVYFDADTSFSKVQLPLTDTSPSLTYTFVTDSGDYTLTLAYDTQLSIYGEDCPASNYFFNLEVIDHNFDSVAVTNNILTNRITDNIEVYF